MKAGLPAGLILSINILLLFYAIATLATANEAGHRIKGSSEIPAEVLEAVEEAVSMFRAPQAMQGLGGSPGSRDGAGVAGKTDPGSPSPALTTGSTGRPECAPQEEIFYFFSFSMPKESIMLAMEDAVRINAHCRKKVILVLRGFVEGGLKATIREFYALMKEKRVQGDWPLIIDPPLFEKYGVTEVPLIVREGSGGTGSIKGDIRLGAALEKLEEEPAAHGKYGSTYAIKEKDLLLVIASKRAEVEQKLRERAREIKKTAYVLSRYDGKFEQAKEDRVYYLDPSVILTEDIRDHQGRVLFARGSSFNPADYLPLGRYIIIDGNSEKQVRYAIEGDFRKIILISGDLAKLTARHGLRFYFASDTIIDRLEIRKVPAIVEQEGRKVRVTEKSL